MNTLLAEQINLPSIIKVKIQQDSLCISLSDGRKVMVPLAWYPKLSSASKKELHHFEISPAGYGIHWPDIDEDLSLHGFLFPGSRMMEIKK